jgi:hypothetical protein
MQVKPSCVGNFPYLHPSFARGLNQKMVQHFIAGGMHRGCTVDLARPVAKGNRTVARRRERERVWFSC